MFGLAFVLMVTIMMSQHYLVEDPFIDKTLDQADALAANVARTHLAALRYFVEADRATTFAQRSAGDTAVSAGDLFARLPSSDTGQVTYDPTGLCRPDQCLPIDPVYRAVIRNSMTPATRLWTTYLYNYNTDNGRVAIVTEILIADAKKRSAVLERLRRITDNPIAIGRVSSAGGTLDINPALPIPTSIPAGTHVLVSYLP